MAWELGLAVAVAPPVTLRDDAEGYETGCSTHQLYIAVDGGLSAGHCHGIKIY